METLTYQTGVMDAIPCKSEYPLSKTSAASYSGDVRPVIASYRKLLCMNVKQPNVIRVLNRQGKYTDSTLKTAHVRSLCSTECSGNHAAQFYAVGGKDLCIIRTVTQASGELQLSMTETTYEEELYAATPGEKDRLFVLGSQHVFLVDEVTGTHKSKIDLPQKTSVKYPTFDYHRQTQVLLTPAKTGHLDVMSTSTNKSVLMKMWEPHAATMPTFARFFQDRVFAEEVASEVLIVTAAKGNSEIRFWAYNNETKRFTLKQELTIMCKDGANEEYDIAVAPSEDYITLTSRRHAFAVVVEVHRSQFKAHRVTTWKMPGPALCCTTYVGKVAESSQSKSVNYELFVTVRTAEAFVQSMLDANKLAGASNTASMKPDSVMTWFDKQPTPATIPPTSATTSRTAVSSTILGDSKSINVISEVAAAEVVRNQADKFCRQVTAVNDELVVVQKSASSTMRLFQDSRFREEAQSNGRKFAARNRGRLEKLVAAKPAPAAAAEAAPAEPGAMTEGQRELILSINNFVREVEGASEVVAKTALSSLLKKRLRQSVEKASKDMETLEVSGSADMTVGLTESARDFRNMIEVCKRQMLAAIREHQSRLQISINTSSDETKSSIQRATEFEEKLRAAIGDLKREVDEVKTAVAEVQASGAAAAPVDPDVLVARAVERAEKGDWAGAMTVALESSDITVLLAFLESKVSTENMSTLTSPKTLPLPLFLSLCLQLTFEMDAQPGAIPLRVQLFHHFYVDWDDALRTVKIQAAKDPRQNNTFEILKRELTTVYESISQVDMAALDRRSRNYLRLVMKLIGGLLTDA